MASCRTRPKQDRYPDLLDLPSSTPVIVAARRTPIAAIGHRLAQLNLTGLTSPVLRAVCEDAEEFVAATDGIRDVVLGNCMGPGGNPARLAALAAGLGTQVPGATVDRQCGSGLAAILDAAAPIRAGDPGLRLAGGAESPSTAPARSFEGVPYARAAFAPEGFSDPDMPQAAEDLAAADGITRQRQDNYAMQSHRRAADALTAGRLRSELVPLGGLKADEGIGRRPEVIPRLRPLVDGGTVTAGNSTRINDGAAAVLLAPASAARARMVPGLALRSQAIMGCDPSLPGLGAAPALQRALAELGADVGDLAALEIVEAFAAQTLAVLDRLGIAEDDPRVCAEGGALALGHPWGASGAVAVVRLFSRLVRSGAPAGTLGAAAVSVGGGLGIAAVVEVVR